MKRYSRGRRNLEGDLGFQKYYSNVDSKTYSSSVGPPSAPAVSCKLGPNTEDSISAMSSISNHTFSVVIHDHADIDSRVSGRQAVPCRIYGKIYEDFLVDRVPPVRRKFEFHGEKGGNEIETLGGNKGMEESFGPPSQMRRKMSNDVASKYFQSPIDGTISKTQRPTIHRGPREGQRDPQCEGSLDGIFKAVEKLSCHDVTHHRNEIDEGIRSRKQELPQKAFIRAWEGKTRSIDKFIQQREPRDGPPTIESANMSDRASGSKNVRRHSVAKTAIDKRHQINKGLTCVANDRGNKKGMASSGGSETSGSRPRERRIADTTKARMDNEANADFLDHTFEGLQQATCHAADTDSPKFSHEKDYLDTVFEGLEGATCRPGNTRLVSQTDLRQPRKAKFEDKETFHRTQTFYRTQNRPSQSIEQRDDVDMFDSFCNGVEYYVCRERGVGLRPQRKPDFLDSVCEPFAPGGSKYGGAIQSIYDTDHENRLFWIIGDDDEDSGVESVERRDWVASSLKGQRRLVGTKPKKEANVDILDYVFENVESRLCQPQHNDLSLA